jgi:hypothetical protein
MSRSRRRIDRVKRTIRIHRIHNRTRPPVKVHVPHVDGSTLTVEPGQTVEGPWLVEYDPDQHPELSDIADENEWWFTDSPDVFTWGSVMFPNSDGPGEPQPEPQGEPGSVPKPPQGPRMTLEDWSALYDDP